MKLIRFGAPGAEKPGLLLPDGARVDASAFGADWDERFFGADGLARLAAWARDHDDHADEDLLHVGRPAHLLAAVAEEGHDEGADHGPQDAALAAAQAAAADDDGGDDVELGARGHRRVALAQARHLHHARQAEEEAGHPVDRELEPVDRDAAGPGRRLARAEGEHPAAEHRPAEDEGHE